MSDPNNLSRFISAQQGSYDTALREVQDGRKRTHWMWYIFPQVLGLGKTDTSIHYAIRDLGEAKDYLEHPVLGMRLLQISRALLELDANNAHSVFGSPDDLKLRSSMTLFSLVEGADPVFQQVLDKFFNGQKDEKTIALLTNFQAILSPPL
ncbi:DUF1810 domain-containing protein [Pedobacter deserti]|uniref:DUF1810 domain-containing protein n=1 Tax=Pedobacter deserti TaxID=2817382 RepID=UPI00210AABF0|nr:DUF1810 domain-containing protein [Pedobacter sp. SYSU D00382]